MNQRATLQVNALRVVQDRKHPLFMFVVPSDQLADLTDVARIRRTEQGELDGYQRGEVRRHVRAITEYLDSQRGYVLFPHALILALTKPVEFTAITIGTQKDGTEIGTLTIPLSSRNGRAAFLVDGQQRSLALAKARRRDFPVPVCAFHATDIETQREQFLRVNNTHPLPRGLVSELLPDLKAGVPDRLASKQAPSALVEMLNRDPKSPFHGLIRRASYPPQIRRKAVVSDTALIKILEESFNSPNGALFGFRNVGTGTVDLHGAKKVVMAFWNAVRATFPDAWGQSPRKSRLMHSAGLRAMGKLMDRAMAGEDLDDPRLEQKLRRELTPLKNRCRWTSGVWDPSLGLDWDGLQNVTSHVKMLTDFVQRVYFAE
jgi:DGQHR domain-containing protein